MRYVDVNVLVYWLGDDPQFGKPATDIMTGIEHGEAAATSALTLWLTHIVLSRLAMHYAPQAMLARIRRLHFFKIVPLLPEDFTQAVSYTTDNHLDLEDALHLASALRLGIQEIYTFDNDFVRTPLKVWTS